MRSSIRVVVLALGWLVATGVASGATTTASGPPAARATSSAKRPAVGTAAPRRASAKGGGATAGKTEAAGAKRTLQDIHIEGEIPVPQVLFITARDQRRFVDFQHRRYVQTSQEVGVQTIFPSEIALTSDAPAALPRETSR